MATMVDKGNTDGGVVWQGRPAIGVYVALYGILALAAIAILVGLELYTAHAISSISSVLDGSLKAGPVDIPYGLEVITALIIAVVFLVKVVGLLIVRTSNSYELRTDGLYVNKGIANLQNTFISAMAFSDARLTRTLGMRIVGRGRIVVEANDGRRFELMMIKDSSNVQSMIRSSLSHPTVRVEK
jgi:hypothetical protein